MNRKHIQFHGRLLWSLGLLLLVGLMPQLGLSANWEGAETVKITTPQTGDTYLAGGEVSVQAMIDGDLIVGGGKIWIQDTVKGDLLVGGGEVEIRGFIADDIRIAAGDIRLEGNVAGDVVMAGGTLEIREGVIIVGDLTIAGGTVNIYGTIQGALNASGGEVHFLGTAEQSAEFHAGMIRMNGSILGDAILQAQEIKLGEQAKFHGKVDYWQNGGELDFGSTLFGGEANFDEGLAFSEDWDSGMNYFGLGFFMFWFLRLIGVGLFLMVLVWLASHRFRDAADRLLVQPVQSLGIGFLYLIGVPVVSIILMAIVIGLPFGVFLLANYGFSLLFGQMIAILLLTYAFTNYYQKDWSRGMIWMVAILGYILLNVISWIPVLGFLVNLIVIAAAFGALLAPLFQRSPEPFEEELEEVYSE